MADQRRPAHIPDLEPFAVSNVRVTGRELGRGAYGSVEEVEIPGAVCAAKKLHDELFQVGIFVVLYCVTDIQINRPSF